VFKESVGDAATLPAVALQVHALKAYPAWASLFGQLNVPELEAFARDTSQIGRRPSAQPDARPARCVREPPEARTGWPD